MIFCPEASDGCKRSKFNAYLPRFIVRDHAQDDHAVLADPISVYFTDAAASVIDPIIGGDVVRIEALLFSKQA